LGKIFQGVIEVSVLFCFALFINEFEQVYKHVLIRNKKNENENENTLSVLILSILEVPLLITNKML